MPWIKSCDDLETHPKLRDLCDLTNWNLNEAIGKLQRFWWWVAKYAEDGDLSIYKPLQYLDHIKGDLSAPELQKIFEDVGFIDRETNLVHNWFKYAGNYLRIKYHVNEPKKYARMLRKWRKKKGWS